MMPNLDVTGHQWVGMPASFQFKLEYQKGADNGAADALSWVPVSHSWETSISPRGSNCRGGRARSEQVRNSWRSTGV